MSKDLATILILPSLLKNSSILYFDKYTFEKILCSPPDLTDNSINQAGVLLGTAKHAVYNKLVIFEFCRQITCAMNNERNDYLCF